MADRILKILKDVVGQEWASSDRHNLISYTRDMSPYPTKEGEYIVLPGSNEEISGVLLVANNNKIPVYMKGAGTTFGGLGIPRSGGIVMDFNRMNKTINIDEKNLLFTCQCGQNVYNSIEQLRARGLDVPLWPMYGASVPWGSWVNTSASGMFQFGAGLVWDNLFGMEVVLATGEIVKVGINGYANCGPIARYMAGSDVMGIFLGASGGMGVCSEITTVIRTVPEAIEFITLGYQDENIEMMTAALQQIGREGVAGEVSIADDGAAHLVDVDIPARVLLMVYADGTLEQADYGGRVVRRILKETGAVEIEFPIGQIFHQNNALLGSMTKKYGGGMDCLSSFASSYESFAGMFRQYKEIYDKYGMFNMWYAWVMNGYILHFPWVAYPEHDPDFRQTAREIRDQVYDQWFTTPNVSGGYFGPFPHMIKYLRPTYYELLRRVKRTMDPNNILCPGILPY